MTTNQQESTKKLILEFGPMDRFSLIGDAHRWTDYATALTAHLVAHQPYAQLLEALRHIASVPLDDRFLHPSRSSNVAWSFQQTAIAAIKAANAAADTEVEHA